MSIDQQRIKELLEHSITLTYQSPEESLRLAREACQLASKQCEPRLHIAALHQQMSMLFAFGKIHEGCHVLLPALVIAENEDFARERGDLLHHLGVAHYTLGEYLPAIDYWSDCLDLDQKDYSGETRINAHIGIGQIYFACTQFDDALRHHQLALRWLTPQTDDELRLRLLINLVADLYELARLDEAFAYAAEALTLSQRLNHLEYMGEVLSYKTLIAVARGQYPEAKAYIATGQQLVKFWAWGEIHWHTVSGRTQQAEGQLADAIASFQLALEIANKMNCTHQVFVIHRLLAATYRELQQHTQAEYHHRLYQEQFHRLLDPAIFGRLKKLEAQLSNLKPLALPAQPETLPA